MTRKYSSISTNTTLAASITSSATSMTVATGTATTLLGGVTLAVGNVDSFTVALDPDTANEEIVFVTAVSGDTLTIVRGRSGSSAVSHAGGATVKHVLVSADLDSFESTNNNAVTLTGTQTLTNKNLTSGTNTFPSTMVTTTGTQALTNKDLSSGTNTLPTSVVTLTGSQTLTNKTLTSPTLTAPIATLSINNQTGTTYTFVASDAGALVYAQNASPQTLTIPLNSSVPFAIGSQISVLQVGAGQISIQGASGVTVLSTAATAAVPKTRAQYSAATLIKCSTDLWYVVGDIA